MFEGNEGGDGGSAEVENVEGDVNVGGGEAAPESTPEPESTPDGGEGDSPSGQAA